MMARKCVIDVATEPTSLRAGLKWDPLEKDVVEESGRGISDKRAWAKIALIWTQIVLLWIAAFVFRLGLVFRGKARKTDKERADKAARKREMEKYLADKKADSHDLDLCCFCYGRDGKMIGFVAPDITEMHGVSKWHPAFLHSGDDSTGTGDAFDEELVVKLPEIEESIHKMYFLAISAHHGFNEIKGGFWSLVSTQNEKELMSTFLKTAERHRVHIMARASRDGKSWVIEEVAEYAPLATNEAVSLQNRVDQLLRKRFPAGA